MLKVVTWLVRILVLLCVALAATPQGSDKPGNDVFSGNVTELTADSVTVVRRIPAQEAVSRRFIRDAQTKVEGPLKVTARVTVRFETDSEGQFHALHIIVR